MSPLNPLSVSPWLEPSRSAGSKPAASQSEARSVMAAMGPKISRCLSDTEKHKIGLG